MISTTNTPSLVSFIFESVRSNFDLSIDDIKLSQMSADASVKQYFRVMIKDQRFILLALPTCSDSSEEDFSLEQDRKISQAQSFIESSTWLNENMRHIPRMYASNMAEGLVLLSDNGAKNLFDYLPTMSESMIENYYKALIDWNVMLEAKPIAAFPLSLMRQFTESDLETELMDFIEYGLQVVSATAANTLQQSLQKEFKELVLQIGQLPKTLLHRDFQSKNILCEPSENSFVIIDFQDMCIGPKYYDLASLIFDPYVSLEPSSVDRILYYYYQSSASKNSYELFLKELSLVAVQRLLKAAGRYARLKYRHGKNTHMQFFIPALKKIDKLISSFNDFLSLKQVIKQYLAGVSH